MNDLPAHDSNLPTSLGVHMMHLLIRCFQLFRTVLARRPKSGETVPELKHLTDIQKDGEVQSGESSLDSVQLGHYNSSWR